MNQQSTSLWIATSVAPKFETLRGGVHVDVAIIGAGITGLTAAILLKNRGIHVAVLEKARIGSGETGHTTAHLTRTFSKDAARLVGEASRASIDLIESLVKQYSIGCRFRLKQWRKWVWRQNSSRMCRCRLLLVGCEI
ncbi:MAG TPA: FAD-dependent oxidoreductase [Thermoanaerobaculia bacterium]